MLWEHDFKLFKIPLRSPLPFQLICDVVRDISWMLTVLPITSQRSQARYIIHGTLNLAS